jgi:hypothetical protein
MALRVISAILLVLGAAVVYGAKYINRKLCLGSKMKVPENYEFTSDEDREKFIEQKALVTIKLYGLILVIPGLVLAFIAFK